MKKFATYILLLITASSLSTSALFGQNCGQDDEMVCEEPACHQGANSAMRQGWLIGGIVVAAVVAGIVVISVNHSSTTAH